MLGADRREALGRFWRELGHQLGRLVRQCQVQVRDVTVCELDGTEFSRLVDEVDRGLQRPQHPGHRRVGMVGQFGHRHHEAFAHGLHGGSLVETGESNVHHVAVFEVDLADRHQLEARGWPGALEVGGGRGNRLPRGTTQQEQERNGTLQGGSQA